MGTVVEVGKCVTVVKPGARVILTTLQRGTWRYYGVYHERDVHSINSTLPLVDASMLMISPCTAYRMIKDFRKIAPGQTIMQNAPNSPIGQCIIQLCKAWDINTFNIVPTKCCYKYVKERLLRLGATEVCTLEEAECRKEFTTSMRRPVLAFNCLGGHYEDVLLKTLQRGGDIVYYGSAFNNSFWKRQWRPDLHFHRFHIYEWDKYATCLQKDVMLNDVLHHVVTGHLRAPAYEPIEFRNYVEALKYTPKCEALAMGNYVFDFTMGD